MVFEHAHTYLDSVIGEPLFTIPLSDTQHLCYEIYGDMDQYFNYISTTCVSVNAHYVEYATDLVGETRPLHVIDKIAIRAVDSAGKCVNILVERNGCTISANSVPNPAYSSNGVTVNRVGNRISVNVPNCNDTDLNMDITCQTLHGINMLRLEVMKAVDITDTSHGLMGTNLF